MNIFIIFGIIKKRIINLFKFMALISSLEKEQVTGVALEVYENSVKMASTLVFTIKYR